MPPPIVVPSCSVPPPHSHEIARPHLIERLAAGLRDGHTVTLISAAAGSGKTVLAAAWLRHSEWPVRWVALDHADRNMAHGAAHLVAALQQGDGALAQAIQQAFERQPDSPTESMLALLLSDSAALPVPLILVLDNLQTTQTPSFCALFDQILAHQSPQLHLVLLTREDPPLALPRLRAQGLLTELRTADLRFSGDDIARFLRQSYGMMCNAAELAALEAYTDGWITGIQLAALAHQEQEHAHVSDIHMLGSHRYVADYFAEEVLRHVPSQLRVFLQQTALLERFTAPLCDAVTEHTDSARCLRRLERTNLFLFPLDDHREWYRYQPMFAEYLRSTVPTDVCPLLHGRAAAWYWRHGSPDTAVEHAFQSGNQQLAAQLITQAAGQAIRDGHLAALLRWLDRLSDSLVRADSALAMYKGWCLWLFGDADAAISYAASAQAALPPGGSAPTHGRLLGLQACLSLPDAHTPAHFHAAFEALGAIDPLFHALIMLHLADRQLGPTDISEMVQVFGALAQVGQHGGAPFVSAVALSHLAMAHHQRGERHMALALCQSALARFKDRQGRLLPVAGPIAVAAGRLAYAANDLELARQQLETGLALVEQLGYAPARIEARVALAWLQRASGQKDDAFQMLAAARAIAHQMHLRRLVDDLACLEAGLRLWAGNRPAAEAWAMALEKDEPLWDVTSHSGALRAKTYARLLMAQRRPEEACELLIALVSWERSTKRHRACITTTLLLSRAHQLLGNLPQAHAELAEAIGMAVREDERRVFLDEGSSVAQLLPSVREVAPRFVDDLLAAFDCEVSVAGQAHVAPPSAQAGLQPGAGLGLPEPLSEREQEILHLIALGMPNAAIARALIIAPGTVKKHLDHIYGKLGAHNRTAAVARARQLDLLG